MIVRIRGRLGLTRIELENSATVTNLYQQVNRIPEANISFSLSKDPAGSEILHENLDSLASLGIQ